MAEEKNYNIENNLEKMKEYGKMAKSFMNKPFNHPNDVVGNYGWHEEFPYEKELLTPVAENLKIRGNVAIDFGCGPGRMIRRMYKTGLFERVDGIDVSDYALEYAKSQFSSSNFYSSNGYDVGGAPFKTYDLVYSTIAMQHIACRSIRDNIYKGFHHILNDEGVISLQFAFNATKEPGVWSFDTEHVNYLSDAFDAKATNGHADFILNLNALDHFRKDLSRYFDDVKFNFVQVDSLYNNLNGQYHAPYWASHWLFVSGKKNNGYIG